MKIKIFKIQLKKALKVINKEIVTLINHFGGNAVGLCGRDGGLIEAKKMIVEKDNPEFDVPEIISTISFVPFWKLGFSKYPAGPFHKTVFDLSLIHI